MMSWNKVYIEPELKMFLKYFIPLTHEGGPINKNIDCQMSDIG